LGIKSDMVVKSGTTIKGLKEQIALEDPTGSTQPDQFGLTANGPEILDEAFRITAAVTELEIIIYGDFPPS